MKKSCLALVLLSFLPISCSAVKKVNHGVKWSYEKTTDAVGGATRMVGGAAKKLWPWSKEEKPELAAAPASTPSPNSPKPPAPVSAPAPASAEKPVASTSTVPAAAAPSAPADTQKSADDPAAPSYQFPSKDKLLVTDATLGADKRTDSDSMLQLKSGWQVTGSRLHYVAEFAGDSPSLLRAEGSPCRATADSSGKSIVAQAREIHYRQDTGVMVLKGFPAVQIGKKKISAASGETVIMLHLESGALQSQGAIKTSE